MKTDKQLYAIFSAMPEWIFELTGLKSPGKCELQAISLKALEQQADAVIVPDDDSEELTVVEFQFQEDDQIYTRIVIEMALLQQSHRMRQVRGIIFFRYPSLDPETEPWRQIIRAYTLRDMIESLAQRAPEHPLVAVFQPVLLSNEETLEAHAGEYYHQIRSSDVDEGVRATLLEVFVNWLEQRLKSKGKEEIENMLIGELPDLRDTKSGQDLIRIGRNEGKIEGKLEGKLEGKREGKIEGELQFGRESLLSLLEDKFGVVPPEIRQRIEKTDAVDRLKKLLHQVIKIDALDQLTWS